MTDHGHPVELLPELALGVLPLAEAAPVHEHIRTCEACASEFRDLDRVAALLPLATIESSPSPALKERLMQRVAAESGPSHNRATGKRWRWLGGAAAAVLVVGLIAGLLGYLAGNDDSRPSGSIAPEEYGIFARAVAQGIEKRSSVTSDGVTLAVVHAPGRAVAYVWVDGLPPLAEGQVYQPWVSDDGGRTMEPLAAFAIPNGGVWLQAPAELEGFSWFGLSIELEQTDPGEAVFIELDLAPSPSQGTPEYP